jgi:hypothetical protein
MPQKRTGVPTQHRFLKTSRKVHIPAKVKRKGVRPAGVRVGDSARVWVQCGAFADRTGPYHQELPAMFGTFHQ